MQQHLIQAFEECGLPEAMLMDHGIPWWQAQSFAGATHLSLWLMRQGIALHFSGIRHPQTQGKVERFHGSMERALDCRGVPADDHQQWLDEFRREHNHIRPHEALQMQTPASRWQPSPRSYQPNPPAWQYPEDAWTLKVDNHGRKRLCFLRKEPRRANSISSPCHGVSIRIATPTIPRPGGSPQVHRLTNSVRAAAESC